MQINRKETLAILVPLFTLLLRSIVSLARFHFALIYMLDRRHPGKPPTDIWPEILTGHINNGTRVFCENIPKTSFLKRRTNTQIHTPPHEHTFSH